MDKPAMLLPPERWSRRQFLGACTAAAAACASLPLARAGVSESPAAVKRVSLIATEVWKYCHAQHFIDRLLEGYGWQGQHHSRPLKLVSMYIDHFPPNHPSRERERRHGVKIFPSISEALTLGGSELAVNGVLIIGEHGKYPRNAKGQML